VKARFTIDRRSYYYPIGGSCSKQEFSEICNVQKSKSPKYEEKKRLLETVDRYKEMLVNLNPISKAEMAALLTELMEK